MPKGVDILKYILMNKHTELAEIEISDSGIIESILDIYNIKAFPVGITRKDPNINSMREIQNNLNEWWQKRTIPSSRQGLISVLQEFNIDTTSVLAMKALGLSLSDQYWMKPLNSTLTWDEINFFNNDFSKDIGEAFFNPNFIKKNINFISPDNTSDGWLRKKWIIINGKRCLVKAGSDPYRQEPFNEVIASKIIEKLNTASFVKYKFFKDEEQGICSICKNFVTEDTELVSGYALSKTYSRDKNTSVYDHYIDIAEKLNIPNIGDYFDSLIILDYIIANTDRHHNNFGFIRDVNTLKFIGPAPIFDSGTSMWHNYSVLSGKIGSSIISQLFYKSHEMQLDLVKNWKKFDFFGLNDLEEEIYNVLKKNPLSSEKRNTAICRALNERIQSVKLYQIRKSNQYNINFNDVILLEKYKTLQFNLEPVYFFYKKKFSPDKTKYNPVIDKQILKQILIDGFSIQQAKKILIHSPNIKSEKMIELLYRSLSNNKELKHLFQKQNKSLSR